MSQSLVIFMPSARAVADKILQEHELFGHSRFMAQIDIGGLPFANVAQVIGLLAAKVALGATPEFQAT